MASPRTPLGPFLGNAGEITPGGAIHFLNPTTDVPKEAFADSALTISAANPIILDSSGRTPYQVYYGVGDYKLIQYALIDPDMGSPVFPVDYYPVAEWIDEAYTASGSSSTTSSVVAVDTIVELTDTIDPTEIDVVKVIGYFSFDDDIDSREYYYDEFSTATPDGGSVLASTLVGTGRWILKTNSPVIDVRWFGAIPESGIDCNSAVQAACTFAVNSLNVKPVTVYFPQGNYIFAPGTITTVATIRIDQLVTFFTRIAGDFVLNVQAGYQIDKYTALQHPSSVGTATLSFQSNTWSASYGAPVNVGLYESPEDAFKFTYTTPMLIDQPINLTPTQDYPDKSVRFTGTGRLTLVGTAFDTTFIRVTTDDDTYARFSYLYLGDTILFFEPTVELYSAWFLGNDAIKFAGKDGCTMVINVVETMLAGYTLNLSSLGALVARGGYFVPSTSCFLTLPKNTIGKCVSLDSTDDISFVTTSTFDIDASNFIYSTSQGVKSFIRIANTSKGRAIFNGDLITVEVDLSSLSNISVSNVTFNNDLTLGASNYEFKNANITGGEFTCSSATTAFYNSAIAPTTFAFNQIGNLSMKDSSLVNSATYLVGSLTAESSVIGLSLLTGDSALSVLYLDKCITTFGATGVNGCRILCSNMNVRESQMNDCKFVGVMSGSNSVKMKFIENYCEGTFIGPEGATGAVDYIYIERNHFQNTNALTLYEPITTNSFTPSSDVITRGINIEGNTPAIEGINVTAQQVGTGLSDQTWFPCYKTTGTRVRQTNIKVWDMVVNSSPSFPLNVSFGYFRIPVDTAWQNFLWTPAGLWESGTGGGFAAGTKLHHVSATFGYTDQATSTSIVIDNYIDAPGTITGQLSNFEGINGLVKSSSLSDVDRIQFQIDLFPH